MKRRILAHVVALAVAVVAIAGCGDSKPTKANPAALSGAGVPGKPGPSMPPAPKAVE